MMDPYIDKSINPTYYPMYNIIVLLLRQETVLQSIKDFQIGVFYFYYIILHLMSILTYIILTIFYFTKYIYFLKVFIKLYSFNVSKQHNREKSLKILYIKNLSTYIHTYIYYIWNLHVYENVGDIIHRHLYLIMMQNTNVY